MLEEIEKLEKVKKRLGLTQSDLLRQLDLGSRKTIYRWLSGASDPTAQNLKKLRAWLKERDEL